MLKIKAPLKIKCDYSIEKCREDFSQKIMGNYTLMNNYIRREELLFVTTQAPEVYFAEGDSFSIFNDIKNENQQEFRLDVINQLVNRILVSNTDNFTYQDSVYISNVLRKIGITDVSKFMKQVHKLQEEKNENLELVNLYEEQKDILYNILKEENNNTYDINKQENNNEYINKSKYYIHEDVYKRLDTVDIYNDMKLYTQGVIALDKRIYANEVAIAEQISMVNQFDLHNIKKEIFNHNQPINYYHANEYELLENEQLNKMDAQARISAAILLNLVDNLYTLRLNQIEKNNHNWYAIAGSLFQSSDNTWKRYEAYHNDGKKFYANVIQTLTQIVDNKKTEKNIINSIINDVRNTNSELTNFEENILNESIFTDNINKSNIINNSSKKYKNENNDLSINNASEEFYEFKNKQKTFIDLLEQLKISNSIDTHSTELINEIVYLYNDYNNIIDENDIDTFVTLNNIKDIEEIKNKQETLINILEEMKTSENVEINNVELINEIVNLYKNYISHLTKNVLVENAQLNNVENYIEVDNQRKSFIKTLNEMQLSTVQDVNKDIFINEIENLHNNYQNNQVNDLNIDSFVNVNNFTDYERSLKTINNNNTELFNLTHLEEYIEKAEDNEEARQITELTINKLDEINKQNVLNYQRILEIEKGRPKQKNISVNKKKAREDILRALDNPQEVIMEYIQNNSVDNFNSINNNIDNQIYNMFSEETKAIFNQVMQIQNKSGDNVNLSTNILKGDVDSLKEIREFFNETNNKEILKNKINENHFNNVNMTQRNVDEYEINDEIINSINEIENNVINRLSEDKKSFDDISQKQYSKEIINTFINKNNDISLNMVKTPVVKYEISEMIRNEIVELKNSIENNMYDDFFSEEIKPKKKRGRKSKATIELEKRNEVKKIELQHFMEKSQQNDVVIMDKQSINYISKNVNFVHKKEEQVITEDLLETIKSQTVDLVKEETVTHNQIINHTKTQQQINDTVNEIKINNNSNIEEIVQQSMKKQLNHLTDQVYGKIEKKLQTERKRRGI